MSGCYTVGKQDNTAYFVEIRVSSCVFDRQLPESFLELREGILEGDYVRSNCPVNPVLKQALQETTFTVSAIKVISLTSVPSPHCASCIALEVVPDARAAEIVRKEMAGRSVEIRVPYTYTASAEAENLAFRLRQELLSAGPLALQLCGQQE